MPSLWETLTEAVPAVAMGYAAAKAHTDLPADPDLAFCYSMLNEVSRSFAIVIQQLPTELRVSVCVFYLVLRALDTVEDDMAVPIPTKVPLLKAFHEKIYDGDFKFECGQGPYVRLMRYYPSVTSVFLRLKEEYQKVIADITRRMGAGMAEFIEREVESVADYDRYCHYVAGLVGLGLTQLFVASGLEAPGYCTPEQSNHMGLFLQKTNILRDYLEDINEEPAPRMFWPREVWGRHAKRLEDFREPKNSEAAVACLDELVTDALRHAPHCLAYLQGLRNAQVFRFCAIPQVMAIGTLALCYDNPRVFTGVVKMRRGRVAKHMWDVVDVRSTSHAFAEYADLLASKAEARGRAGHADAQAALAAVRDIRAACGESRAAAPPRAVINIPDWALRVLLVVLAAAYFAHAFGLGDRLGLGEWLGPSRGLGSTYLEAGTQVTASLVLAASLGSFLVKGRPRRA